MTTQFQSDILTALSNDIVKVSSIERYSSASDASFYYLIPQVVVYPKTERDIQILFEISRKHKTPIVFRAGGTSLSGQSITDGILVDISKHWRKVSLDKTGDYVTTQPGIIGGTINQLLKKYHRKIGPDPSSINAAMMGGIISNNASGMCCGVEQNSYHTLHTIKIILPNGFIFDTKEKLDYKRFETETKELFDEITFLRKIIFENKTLHDKIRKKYRTKNTVGYSLNAFIDFTHPLDILAHLMVGGEGTLGFISEAVIKTVPDHPHKLTGFFYFSSIEEACNSIAKLKTTNVKALELFDWGAIQNVSSLPDALDDFKTLPQGSVMLLFEYQEESDEKLNETYRNAQAIITSLPLLRDPFITKDEYLQVKLWKFRKGLYPTTAGARKKGTGIILEDVAFPIEKLSVGCRDLIALLHEFGYTDSYIIGHAKDGNLHFIITPNFDNDDMVVTYEKFMKKLADVIMKHDGALKAEHGTGRNIAPFVETEWGVEAYEIMKRLKQIIDPHNLVNPDVIISNDPNIHLKNFKTLPIIEDEVNKCVECGFCEKRCPSRDVTLTPRQRIGIRRAIERLNKEGKYAEIKEISDAYQYYGLDTCAVDGSCMIDCPVHINTGDLVKRLRMEGRTQRENKLAMWVAKNYAFVEKITKIALTLGSLMNMVFGKKAMTNITKAIHTYFPEFPIWSQSLIGSVSLAKHQTKSKEGLVKQTNVAIYFPACLTRMMGAKENQYSVVDAMMSLSKKAGVQMTIPNDIEGVCCGQAFSSKGFSQAQAFTTNKTIEYLSKISNDGALPIVMDITSCTAAITSYKHTLTKENQIRFDKLTILDSIEYLRDYILPHLTISEPLTEIAIHPVCSLDKMDLSQDVLDIARAASSKVLIPNEAKCCGMAGDRMFYFPELVAGATKPEVTEVNRKEYDGYYSTSCSCEMAISETSGNSYYSLAHLLDEVSSAKE